MRRTWLLLCLTVLSAVAVCQTSPLNTLAFPNSDRCSGIRSALQTTFNGVSANPVDARGEVANTLAGQITCLTNMFPYGLSGAQLFLPSGAIQAGQTQKTEMSNVDVIGTGRGQTSGAGPTMIAASSTNEIPNGAGILGGASFTCSALTGNTCGTSGNGNFLLTTGTNSGWYNVEFER
jgi:hypothetical protein